LFGYCTSLANLTLPNSITSIASGAFLNCTSLTNIVIPDSVTNIFTSGGDYGAFSGCNNLVAISVVSSNSFYASQNGVLFDKSLTTLIAYPGGLHGNCTIPNGVLSIGYKGFFNCINVTSVTIPNSVTNIGLYAFDLCTSLTNVTIGSSVTSIGTYAFAYCSSLTGVYFRGNSPTPTNVLTVFQSDNNATVYYLPGTTGWGSTFDGRPTALWFLPNPLILNNSPGFGVNTNQFGFTISWATNIPVVVEACTNFVNPVWQPVATNTLTSGSSYFSDPQWTNYPGRFYRLRSP
jgi:hypothetical protein